MRQHQRGRTHRTASRGSSYNDERAARRERVLRDLRCARPVSRGALVRGSVVWASVPFAEDETVTKTRPAVVVDVEGRRVKLLPLTSSQQDVVRQSPLYVRLEDWDTAGLTRPSRVTRQEVTVDVMDVTVRVGTLSRSDLARVFG